MTRERRCFQFDVPKLAAVVAVLATTTPATASIESGAVFADVAAEHDTAHFETAEPSDPDALVDIPDAGLRRTLEVALGKEENAPITSGEMASLSDLTIEVGIDELTGLEHAINLVDLDCENGRVSDLAPLARLRSLTWLSLGGNAISDIAPLSELRSLTWLSLGGNAIFDIAPLGGLDALRELILAFNGISDIAPLAGLRSLTWLDLGGNAISDIAPLVANDGLGSGDMLTLKRNPLSAKALETDIPTLQERGVEVEFDAPKLTGGDRAADRPGPRNAHRLREGFEQIPRLADRRERDREDHQARCTRLAHRGLGRY